MRLKRGSSFLGTCVISFLVIACSRALDTSAPKVMPTTDIEADDAIIYGKVVSEIFPDSNEFLVMDTIDTVVPTRIDALVSLKDLERDTFSDFVTRNQEAYPIPPLPELDSRVTFISYHDLREEYFIGDPQIPMELDFVAIREDYPDISNFLRFSRVGFDPTHTQAFLEVKSIDVYEFSCTEYTFFLLSKQRDSWEVIDSLTERECA